MIPRLSNANPIQARYLKFIETLKARGFAGDLNPDYANRVVLATDNSIYQILPQGVLYPRSIADLQLIARLSQTEAFQSIVLSPRGGGTGTNGQSLSDGLIVDLSRHMNRILEVNVEERWVRVQTGVVKDQLNAALKPYGLFFAPELSTSNRATVGGMINTDASGQGSCLYGKTRDHVLALDSVLLDGSLWHSEAIDSTTLAELQRRDDRIGELHRLADRLYRDNRELIEATFPRLNRCLTGYDLAHIYDESGRFNLNALLCGSEGTLAFIAEARLNVLPIPGHAALLTLKYDSFDSALRDAQALMQAGPTSIETIDSKVLNLAMNDIVWDSVRDYFPEDGERRLRGINLVEYTADDPEELEAKVVHLIQHLDAVSGQPGKSFGYTRVSGHAEIAKIWAMRKKAVGLLGNAEGDKRPIPFVEDTAVPPENLADFIAEFRAVLDEHGMAYGMFGHVDAGVLHVRPAIDMKDPAQETAIRAITDAVVALTRKHKGLLWGEHGKGVRSEYAPEFFGPELYLCLQRIKAAFDPRNQLNPGKICTPADSGGELLKIDQVPTRGQHDRQIPAPVRHHFSDAMHCNGNGACYNFDPDDAMCPSWKGTRQRIHSPKGRASLVREWLRLLSAAGSNPAAESQRLRSARPLNGLWRRIRNTRAKQRGEYDFSHEVMEAMAGCLACKSCVSQCPVKVNVPEFRSQFMALYYGRYLRPLRHYLIGSLEFVVPWLARWPAPYNWLMKNSGGRRLFQHRLGMVDSPALSATSLRRGLQEQAIPWATPQALRTLSMEHRQRAVILVQDAFTSHFETELVLDCCELLRRLGFTVLVAPYSPNGKPLHVHGFLKAFERTAGRCAAKLQTLAAFGIPLVGIDPSMTLSYRQEYAKALPETARPEVALLQEWLASRLNDLQPLSNAEAAPRYRLLAHCTEKTNAAASIGQWQRIFQRLGLELEVVNTGCCGMAGTYGHETANLETSRRIYELSWSKVVNDPANANRLLATGYSCRSQVRRMDRLTLPHPIQALRQILSSPP
ncbi:FAD-binding and (Fe-S)-binding domain-containing protein [Motiliproteus sp. SC1-56]|uniref:D-2-hydroxyglutarate dehydrogenase YdiJ n=1 Tax=Motiliproteus sp. SC1-56 TaxID=2799565 RepID=UPI001A8E5F81|nr:FAD-binding and (Fe-S)-binding domain-containing protein [Motiliproteus sp. SC1-56]